MRPDWVGDHSVRTVFVCGGEGNEGARSICMYVGLFQLISSSFCRIQVANIVGRTELLSGVFFLLSLLSYQCCLSHKPNKKETSKYSHQEPLNSEQLQHTAPTQFSWLWLTCSVLLAAVSMLCKEQGITVLGVCLAYDLFVACGKDLWEFFVVLKQAVVDMWSREDASKKRSAHYQFFFPKRYFMVLSLSLSLSLSPPSLLPLTLAGDLCGKSYF